MLLGKERERKKKDAFSIAPNWIAKVAQGYLESRFIFIYDLEGEVMCEGWLLFHSCTLWVLELKTWRALGGKVSAENTSLFLAQMCWQEGPWLCLVKVAPEQTISTSNLNVLKSRNNIESCWSYYKVLLHFFLRNRVENKLGIMWIISLHVSSPGIWHLDQNDGMEQGSHREHVIRGKSPWPPGMHGILSSGVPLVLTTYLAQCLIFGKLQL